MSIEGKEPKKKIGRPTDYTEELADKLCERLSEGESMRTACKDDDMPARATIFRWLREKDGFKDQYDRAKQEACDYMAEELLDIADDGSNDYMEKIDHTGEKTGATILNGEHVQRSRLRVDARKWYLSKMKPKKYGDRLQTDIGGVDGAPAILVDQKWEVEVVEVKRDA